MFLLDGSINFGQENFKKHVIAFVEGVVDAIYNDGDSIQVGLVQYNLDVTDEFFLKDFSTKPEILKAIERVQYKGGRLANTGSAIKHVHLKHFVKEAGSRAEEMVPQIAFLITGGRPVDDAQAAAVALARTGVKVFAVGVKNIDDAELEQLASERAMAFRLSEFSELSELNEQLLESLDRAIREQLCPGEVSKGNCCPSHKQTYEQCLLLVPLRF